MPRPALRVLLSILLLALLAVAWRAQFAFQYAAARETGGWVLLAAAAALFVLWLSSGQREQVPAAAPLSPAVEWALFGALFALGIGFRVVHFTTVPGGMNHDAAFNGMFALDALEGAPYTPYISAAWGRETAFMYLCAALVRWFGNVPEPIQIAATLVGIATLPLFYLFARALCGTRVALVGLALLAVSGWHTLFSRVGWRMIMVPPCALIALFGLWRGLETGRWRYWILTGLGMAFAIYTYDAGRMVPPMVAALLGLFVVVDRRGWFERVRGGVLALAVFLVVGAPMLWYAGTHFEQFKGRAAHLAESEHPSLSTAVAAAATMFNYRGNGNDFFVNEPLLEPLTGALFVFGLLVVVSGARRRANLFLLAGFALALLPGVLASPNGNRCIISLPFVYVILASGLVAFADAVAGAFADRRQRNGAALAIVAIVVAIAGVETYREFLGAGRRAVIGFSPEATAAGEYMRGFGEDYSRYVVSEDWPEYTLAYLSYNGGGTPLENHYLLGRRLADIEDRINRYGRKGLLFVMDEKGAGREALDHLQRLFADHRVEPITAARLGGKRIGTALIVAPQAASHTGLWSDTTRALAVGGETPSSALRCFGPVGDDDGVSMRLQLMMPARDAPHAVGSVALLSQCPPAAGGKPLLTLSIDKDGLTARADRTASARAWSAIDAGRWYELVVSLHRDGSAAVAVDGAPLADGIRLLPAGPRPPRIAGVALSAPAGGLFFIDDLAVLPGLAAPGDARWAAARTAGATDVFGEDFETTPYGQLGTGGAWQSASGPLAVLHGPPAPAHAAAPPPEAGDAFDGGHGKAPGQFDQPVGIAVDAAGDFYVADKGNHRIQKFAPDGSFLLTWGHEGHEPGEFREPHDVATDAEFVYVADTWNQRVQVFDHSGQYMFTITGAPSMSSPRGVFAAGKRIYVAEAGGGRIGVYDRSGALVQALGTQGGDAPGHLVEPVDVALDSHGDVWVVNGGNNRLEHFAADGTPRGSIPVPGWTGSGLKESYLAIDSSDTIYLGDWELGHVRRFRPDGSELPPLGTGLHQTSGLAPSHDRLLAVSRADDVVRVIELK